MRKTKLAAIRAFVVVLLFGVCVTATSAATLDELAARGEVIANADPLSAELRSREAEGPSRRGFDIGMAAAEGHTAPGPGKQRTHDSLSPAEQKGFTRALVFSLERNRHAALASVGAAIARADPRVAEARTADTDVLFWLGFDIATGIFGNPALGARGNTATGPGSLGTRDSLSPAGQRGFNAAVKLHLRPVVEPKSGGASGYDTTAIATRVGENSAGANAVIRGLLQVPDVVGLIFTEAESGLRKAGFETKKTFQDEPDASVTYGHVRATVPAAGKLAADSKVELLIPRSASRLGIGALALSDLERRAGFDLDEGRYEEIHRGADIVMRDYENEPRVDVNGNTYYTGAGVFIEPSDGAVISTLNDTRSIEQYGLGSFFFYLDCEYALRKAPRERVMISYINGAPTTICVMTSKEQISVLQFRKGDNPYGDNSKFHHALFPRQLSLGRKDRDDVFIPKRTE